MVFLIVRHRQKRIRRFFDRCSSDRSLDQSLCTGLTLIRTETGGWDYWTVMKAPWWSVDGDERLWASAPVSEERRPPRREYEGKKLDTARFMRKMKRSRYWMKEEEDDGRDVQRCFSTEKKRTTLSFNPKPLFRISYISFFSFNCFFVLFLSFWTGILLHVLFFLLLIQIINIIIWWLIIKLRMVDMGQTN